MICQLCSKSGISWSTTNPDSFAFHMLRIHGVTVLVTDIIGLKPCGECDKPSWAHGYKSAGHEFIPMEKIA